MAHSTPLTLPTPVITPAPGASLSYMPMAASGDSSRNGEPGSSSARTRSRGKSLPRPTWRLRDSSPPPNRTFSVRALRSATSARIASAFFLKLSERVSMEEVRTVMSGRNCPEPCFRASGASGQAGQGPPGDALGDEFLLVVPRRGEVAVVLGPVLQHNV